MLPDTTVLTGEPLSADRSAGVTRIRWTWTQDSPQKENLGGGVDITQDVCIMTCGDIADMRISVQRSASDWRSPEELVHWLHSGDIVLMSV